MKEREITIEDLRGQLDEYSPEQQMEMTAKGISENIQALIDSNKTLADNAGLISISAKSITDAVASLNKNIPAIRQSMECLGNDAAIRFGETLIERLTQTGNKLGDTISDVIISRTKYATERLKKEEKRVSIPGPAAYCFFVAFAILLLFTGMVVFLNCTCWHNYYINALLICLGIALIALITIILFLYNKVWS